MKTILCIIIIGIVVCIALAFSADAAELEGADGWGGIADRHIPAIPQEAVEEPWWMRFAGGCVDLFWWLRR